MLQKQFVGQLSAQCGLLNVVIKEDIMSKLLNSKYELWVDDQHRYCVDSLDELKETILELELQENSHYEQLKDVLLNHCCSLALDDDADRRYCAEVILKHFELKAK